jgi:N-acetylglucosamine malate deacetylase 2
MSIFKLPKVGNIIYFLRLHENDIIEKTLLWTMKKKPFLFLFLLFSSIFAIGQQTTPVKALIVIAHPDDETGFAGTVYKITKEMHGVVDLCVITNGEGGYKYSTLAESYYGLELTEEKVGRENLPRIRKRELMNAGGIIGIRDFYFLDQKDAHYGLDEREPLDTSWDVTYVERRLSQIMASGRYDYVFCLLPVPGTHGGHKAATLLALKTAAAIPLGKRPVVLGAAVREKKDTAYRFVQYKNYVETAPFSDTASFSFDRSVTFGYNHQLSYKIIVNWEIAEHKSQGTMQTDMNRGDYEKFWFFKINDPARFEKTRSFFNSLMYVPYPTKTYK